MNKINKNRILVSSFLILALSSCTETSIQPIPSRTINPPVTSQTPTPSDSNKPISPAPVVSTSNTPAPTINPTVTPSVLPSSGTPVQQGVVLSGAVYDENGTLLNDVKVIVKSLEEDSSFFSESITKNGYYLIKDVPTDLRIEIAAYKSETWTQKTQVITLIKNSLGEVSNNIIDFGDDKSLENSEKRNFRFLSDKPEIVRISPDNNSTVNPDNFEFTLTFSENVDKKSVEENLNLRYVRENFSSDTILGDGTEGTENTDGPPFILGNSQFILSGSNLDFKWNNNKEVKIKIKKSLLTSNEKVVRYGLSLRYNDSSVKLTDLDGNRAFDQGEFFIKSKYEKNIIFSVDRDIEKPYLDSIDLRKTNSKSIIKLNFSKVMSVNGLNNKDLTNILFYKIYKNDQLMNLNNAVINAYDKTVDIETDSDFFQAGDRIKLEVDINLKDAAGNLFSEGITSGEWDYIKEQTYKR